MRNTRTSMATREPRPDAAKNDPFRCKDDAWVEYDLNDWTVALRLTTTKDGMTIVSELRCFPRPRAEPTRKLGQWKADTEGWGVWAGEMLGLTGGITSSLLRKIRLDAAVATADDFQVAMRQRQTKHEHNGGASDTDRWGVDAALPETSRRERRTGLTDLQFARLAKYYVERIKKGSPRPVRDLAESRNEDIERARDLIHKARIYGFLAKTVQGVKGGALTTKSIELLTAKSRIKRRNDQRPRAASLING